jgi:Pyruvate/2-oxoacid:ferredoxin oxidoreductase delta subunit
MNWGNPRFSFMFCEMPVDVWGALNGASLPSLEVTEEEGRVRYSAPLWGLLSNGSLSLCSYCRKLPTESIYRVDCLPSIGEYHYCHGTCICLTVCSRFVFRQGKIVSLFAACMEAVLWFGFHGDPSEWIP